MVPNRTMMTKTPNPIKSRFRTGSELQVVLGYPLKGVTPQREPPEPAGRQNQITVAWMRKLGARTAFELAEILDGMDPSHRLEYRRQLGIDR